MRKTKLKLEIGFPVVLKTGSPQMTVEKFRAYQGKIIEVLCSWNPMPGTWTRPGRVSYWFPPEALQIL
jgi:hypothetical protein